MKHKASLILMEQLIMILVFALGAAGCLGIFVKAHVMSQETARQDQAVVLARNAAELLRAGEDPRQLDTGDLTLTIHPFPSTTTGFASARIEIGYQDRCLFTLDTGWQEVVP